MNQSTNGGYILDVQDLYKEYTMGVLNPRITFSLHADFRFDEPGIIGLMGANGSGKTTLFEIISGGNPPTRGSVYCNGQNIHQVKYDERDRLAIHYHQSYQVRRMKWTKPNFMMEPAGLDYPIVHMFDEPQFNTQDGYIGFMMDFFRTLRAKGKLVFMSLHPTEQYHLEIVREICEQFMFLYEGALTRYPTWDSFVQDRRVREYLGTNLEEYEQKQLERKPKRQEGRV